MPAFSKIAASIEELWPSKLWRDFSVMVAVSGGADSVALLRGVCEIAGQTDGRGSIVVGHVNHLLRGRESDQDAKFVLDLANSLQLDCASETLTIEGSGNSNRGNSLEANLRLARYAALKKMASNRGVRYLLTAHTEDDQVETILFRILRGTGIDGLVGIPFQRVVTEHLTLVRPLLNTKRQEVVAYLQSQGQAWREDQSNQSTDFTRNRIRNELLPLASDILENDIRQAVVSLGDLAGEQAEFLERASRPVLDQHFEIGVQGIQVDCESISTIDPYLVMAALRLAWVKAGFETKDMTAHKWRRLLEICQKAQAAIENYPGNLRVQRSVSPNRLSIVRQS